MTLLLGVLAASVAGSIHCGAMCGPFVCAYATAGAGQRRGRLTSITQHVAYNSGRLISYVALGMLAGALGAGVESLGAMAGITRAATVLSGVLMLAWGGIALAHALGLRTRLFAAPEAGVRAIGALLLRLRERSDTLRAGAIGLLTTLIPCGWLYAFIAVAAGTGTVGGGALVMSAFWLGTVPMLVFVAAGSRFLLRSLGTKLPLVSASLMLLLGAMLLAGRLATLRQDVHAVPAVWFMKAAPVHAVHSDDGLLSALGALKLDASGVTGEIGR